MDNIMEEYAAFERAMDEEKLYLGHDFDGICRLIGADRDRLNGMIIRELGFDGPSLVDFYLSNFC